MIYNISDGSVVVRRTLCIQTVSSSIPVVIPIFLHFLKTSLFKFFFTLLHNFNNFVTTIKIIFHFLRKMLLNPTNIIRLLEERFSDHFISKITPEEKI